MYYIPSLHSNIISLCQLFEDGHKVTLKGECLWIRDMKGDLLLKVKRSRNRLYNTILQTAVHGCLLSKIEDKNRLWHSGFGHVNFKALATMSTKNMVSGIPKITQPKEVCVGCLMSKQTNKGSHSKLSFT